MVPAAGSRHQVDLESFIGLGCSVNEIANLEVLKSPVGTSTWCAQYSEKIADNAIRAVEATGSLPDAHVGYYLLKNSASACRLTYLSRTTPPEHCLVALGRFDKHMHLAFGRLTALSLNSQQWSQASAPFRHGGLGLRSAANGADPAYLASVTATENLAAAIWPEAVLSVNPHSQRAAARLVHNTSWTSRNEHGMPYFKNQRQWSRRLEDKQARLRLHRFSPDDFARVNAFSAKTSCRWHGAIPSKTLDTTLSNSQFRDNTALQLGVDVADEVRPCSFCATPCDVFGRHALSCTAGGDCTLVHDEIKREVFTWCQRARLRPELERSGLLQNIALPDNRRRPADVLVCGALSLLEGLPGEEAAAGCSRVALDFAVINALGEGHHQLTSQDPLAAAIAYSERKSSYQNTKVRCAAAGIAFEPIVLTAQGGLEPRCAAILHRIAENVAKTEGLRVTEAKNEMLERLGLILARANSRSIARRTAQRQEAHEHRGLKRALGEWTSLRGADVEAASGGEMGL